MGLHATAVLNSLGAPPVSGTRHVRRRHEPEFQAREGRQSGVHRARGVKRFGEWARLSVREVALMCETRGHKRLAWNQNVPHSRMLPMMKHATTCNAMADLGACPSASRTYPVNPSMGRVGAHELIPWKGGLECLPLCLGHAVMAHSACGLRHVLVTWPTPLNEHG